MAFWKNSTAGATHAAPCKAWPCLCSAAGGGGWPCPHPISTSEKARKHHAGIISLMTYTVLFTSQSRKSYPTTYPLCARAAVWLPYMDLKSRFGICYNDDRRGIESRCVGGLAPAQAMGERQLPIAAEYVYLDFPKINGMYNPSAQRRMPFPMLYFTSFPGKCQSPGRFFIAKAKGPPAMGQVTPPTPAPPGSGRCQKSPRGWPRPSPAPSAAGIR